MKWKDSKTGRKLNHNDAIILVILISLIMVLIIANVSLLSNL